MKLCVRRTQSIYYDCEIHFLHNVANALLHDEFALRCASIRRSNVPPGELNWRRQYLFSLNEFDSSVSVHSVRVPDCSPFFRIPAIFMIERSISGNSEQKLIWISWNCILLWMMWVFTFLSAKVVHAKNCKWFVTCTLSPYLYYFSSLFGFASGMPLSIRANQTRFQSFANLTRNNRKSLVAFMQSSIE